MIFTETGVGVGVEKKDRSGESKCESCPCYTWDAPKMLAWMCERENPCGNLGHRKIGPEIITSTLSPNTWLIKAWAG